MSIWESEPNNTAQQANSAVLGQTLQGELGANDDQDFFQLEIGSGGTLTLDFVHPDGVSTTARGILVQLMSADGTAINGTTFRGNGQLEATVPVAGTYYIAVSDNDGSRTYFAEGPYSVTTSFETDPDSAYDGASNDSLSTAITMLADGFTPITAGARLNGSLGSNGDADYFKLSADAGGSLTLDFVHPDGVSTTARGILVQLMSADGAVITSTTFRGNGQLQATVPAAGTYYIAVSDNDGSSTYFADGLYSVTTSFETDPDSAYDGANNDSLSTAITTLADGFTPITAGARLNGSLGSNGDADYFKLSADAGGSLTLDFVHPDGVSTTARGILVQLMSADGAVITSTTFRGNGQLQATVPAAGTYYIAVSDNDGSSTYFADGLYSVTTSFETDPDSAYDGANNNGLSTAITTLADGFTPITAGARLNGSLGSNGDADYFKLSADAGGSLTLDFTHPDGVGTTARGILVQLVSADGTVITSTTFRGNGQLQATTQAAGNYYIAVSDNDGSSTYFAQGAYSITVRQESGLVTGTAGDDALQATTANDRILGLDGDDMIWNSPGYNWIDGGAGTDTVVYSGLRSHYWISGTEGQARVLDQFLLNGNDGIDDLANVERLRFMDKSVAFDIDGTGGQAYRIYQAAFDRMPDEAGLGFWIAYMDAGASLSEVAGHFMASAEFQAMYGNDLLTVDFVEQLYLNVLNRPADADGLAYWTAVIDTGLVSRADTLVHFSESPENQANVIGTIGGGFEYIEWLG